MTVNKNDVITIPKWLVIIVLPILFSAITSYGIYRARIATVETKITNVEESIKRIESKLDTHIDREHK